MFVERSMASRQAGAGLVKSEPLSSAWQLGLPSPQSWDLEVLVRNDQLMPALFALSRVGRIPECHHDHHPSSLEI